MTIDDLIKRIVRARLPLLACFVLVPLLGVLLLGSRQHPVWVANARVQVFDGAPSSTTEADGSSSRVLALATTPGMVRRALADAHVKRDATDLAEHSISAQRLGESTVVEIGVKDTDPAAAGAIVKALANRVATFMNEGSRSHFQSTLAQVDAQIATTNRARDEVTTSLAAASDPRARNSLRARLGTLASTSSQLAQQRTSLVVADANRDLVVAIDPNSRDVRAVSSSLLPRSALAVLLGLVLGLAVAVLLETLRPRLADARAVSRLLGVPVLSARGGGSDQLARTVALAARRQGVETVVLMPLEQRDDPATQELVTTLAAVDRAAPTAPGRVEVGPRVRLKVAVAAGAGPSPAAEATAARIAPTNGNGSRTERPVTITDLSRLTREDEDRAGVLVVVSGAPLQASYDALTTLTAAMRWPVIGIVDASKKRRHPGDDS